MDYFRKILTGPQQGQTPSGAETVCWFTDNCSIICDCRCPVAPVVPVACAGIFRSIRRPHATFANVRATAFIISTTFKVFDVVMTDWVSVVRVQIVVTFLLGVVSFWSWMCRVLCHRVLNGRFAFWKRCSEVHR